MKRILIFSGTTEGRTLAETLSKAKVPALVCVATEYGRQVMPELSGITLHQGRMNGEEMQELMQQEAFSAVVDATHPFATAVSENIRESAKAQGLIYLRLQRTTAVEEEDQTLQEHSFSNNESCAEALLQTEGNILLTTGSKELAVYTKQEALRERLYVRVLPSEESIGLCRSAGLSGKQIIAMQGPFSEEMNRALIGQLHIRHMVTKESGSAGGFAEKASAAAHTGIGFYVIGSPEKQVGLSFSEVCEALEKITGAEICGSREVHISLLGIGMGNPDTLTLKAREKLAAADCLFGAKRLLEAAAKWKKEEACEYPYYLADDILPTIEAFLQKSRGNAVEIVLLFSGDSGFYSGSQKLYQRLETWKESRKEEISIRIYPGISSVSYFAAACKISWQDAKIISIHGKGARKRMGSRGACGGTL